MLHIFYPEYVWFFIYTTISILFFLQNLYKEITPQNLILGCSLGCLVFLNIPHEVFQDNIAEYKHTAFEALLLVTSFALVTRNFSKKLSFYLFTLVVYFSSITLSRSINAENIIIPLASLFVFVGIYTTYKNLPEFCYTKNGVYFLTIGVMVIHNILNDVTLSLTLVTLYGFFALYISIVAFLEKNVQSKIFYTFFAFFILTVTHSFLKNNITDIVSYTILYASIAYFLYNITESNKNLGVVFTINGIIALMHVCYGVVNPSYFLIYTTQSQTIHYSFLHLITTFTYYVITVTVIFSIIENFTMKNVKNSKKNILRMVYTTIITIILVQTQLVQHKISDTYDISSLNTLLMTIMQVIYCIFVYIALLLIKYSINKMPKYTLKMPQIMLPHFNLPTYNDYSLYIEKMLIILRRNIQNIYSNTYILIPVFILFYLIISFIY